MIDMHNKTVVVTGANSGVGFVAAKRLAEAGAEIVMVCRDSGRGETARARIAESATGPAPQLFIADLSSQEEIRDVARDIHFAHDRVDVLLNNAGSVFNKGERSIDGIEKTFATNHLAPFLLTNLLQDQLLAAPAARVVTVASEIYSSKLDFENLQGDRSYNFFKAYQQSKLCNVLFAFELARRLDDTNVTSNVVSPGPSKTGFGANMTGPARTFTRIMKATPRFGTPEKGARTLVYATTDPELEGVTGRFYYKEKELATKPITHDTEIAAHLWQISDELCGLGKGSRDHAPALVGLAPARTARRSPQRVNGICELASVRSRLDPLSQLTSSNQRSHMSDASPTPTTQLSPLGQAAQQDGIVLTQMLIVADVERSVSFYRDVLGATVLREHSPAMLRFHNGWLVINSGGGPTPDKPEVTMTPPEDLNRVSTLMNVRVADIATVYREWNERGAQFLTEPLDNHGAEQRCYLRDPDGYLIELGATTPRARAA